MFQQKLLEVVTAESVKLCIDYRRRIRRARATIEDRELAEEFTRLQFSECHRLHIFIEHPDTHQTRIDNIKRVAVVLLVENRLLSFEVDLINSQRELFQLLRC